MSSDVIDDLLPVYFAGEASPGTVRLVEDYLAAHPEFARGLRAGGRIDELLNEGVALRPDAEKRALERMKRLVRRQTWFLAGALFFTAVPFSLRVEAGRVSFFMFETPALVAAYWLLGAFCWAGWLRARRDASVPPP